MTEIREGVTQFPGGMTLGASGNPDLARRSGRVVGDELRGMGINMNLAPVLDVNNNPKNPVIGIRSFSGDPHQVVDMASAQIQGYHDGGVLTVVKHFPGHGDTSTDSHIDLPTVTHSMDRLNRVELVPFKEVLNRTDAVMSAHITFPALDDTPGLPGTLSHKVLTGLLRERLGYDGVIITDDLEMGAIVDNFSAKEAAVRAVKAGADILLISHDLTRNRPPSVGFGMQSRGGRFPKPALTVLSGASSTSRGSGPGESLPLPNSPSPRWNKSHNGWVLPVMIRWLRRRRKLD